MFFRKSFAIIFIICLFSLDLPAGTIPDLQTRCLQYKSYSIDISSLADFYGALAPDEKEEQLRDWAFYGLFTSLNIGAGEIGELTGMDFPMRYVSLREKYRFPSMPGRIACPDGSDCVILVPPGGSDDRLLQGYLFDRQRVSAEQTPKRVHIFSYSAGAANKEITISYVRTVPLSLFLSPEYGYLEKEITCAEDLKQFLDSVNGITRVEIKKDSIVLGGRKNKFGDQASLGFEDVAVLHQAYIRQISQEQENERRKNYEAFISQKYDQIVLKDRNLKKAIKAGRIKYINIMAQIRKAFPYVPLEEDDSNVGFSLDPLYDHDGIAESLKGLAGKTGRFASIAGDEAVSKAVDSCSSSLLSAAAKINSQRDITPFLKLRRDLSDHKNAAETRLDSLLQEIELDNTYQTARYDGRMKGTSPAMILFYTDLTAKLWALDYNNTAPKSSVTGFRMLSEIKVPKLYWDNFKKLSKTRLWFGLRNESYDINGNEISFEPVAARVYAASSDPLYPGKESKPNFQSGEFLGWWDSHYAPVADYEPYFYKLNELLKWSCVMMVLKERHSRSLDFLGEAPVNRTLDFEEWYVNNDGLKSKTALPFVDRTRFNKTTECFKILQSNCYPLMGTTFIITGGVSLASKKDIAAKLSKHAPGRRHQGPERGIKQTPAGKTGYAKTSLSGNKTGTPPSVGQKTGSFGDFSATTVDQTVKLRWNRNDGAVLDECVNSLVTLQMNTGGEGRNENIFSGLKDSEKVVRLEAGRTYLIKTRLLKDKWIYLSINPGEKTAGFTAKAAGTEPDSDIFYAKTIPQAQAEKYISDNKGVTISE